MTKQLLLTTLTLLTLLSVSHAQDHKKFRVGLGAGLTFGDGAGLLWTIEPAYRLSNDLVIGLRVEGAGIGINENGFASHNLSFTGNALYYLGARKVRPFVGAGLGYYSINYSYYDRNNSKFGFYPRVGVDYGHMFLALDYNIIQSTTMADIGDSFKNSYLGVRYGLYIGGGRKK